MEPGKNLQFVLLEDDDLDAELLKERMAASGMAITWSRARGEREFRAALQAGAADLVISDFSLPGYDGFAALALTQSLAPGTPFLFVSGAIGEELATETLRRGATDYVLKDRLQRLSLAVSRALELAGERRRRESAESERDRLLESERRAREAAETANRLKDEFLATASHELRTPLNAILGWAKLLRLGQGNRELLDRGLSTIERNAVAQSRLIDDILDISRIVSGKVQLRPARTGIASLMLAASDALRPAAVAKNIELTLDIDDAGELEVDAERLQQVVWNLISNAVKFTPSGGKVRISAERNARALVLRVQDNGDGLAPGEVSRVFERFWQADPSTSRRQGGLGLGLSIVRYLVELHGGRVWAESDGLGRGARFSVELPNLPSAREPVVEEIVAPDTERDPLSTPPDLDAIKNTRVLLVEDDDDSREIIALILKQRGALVTAVDGAEAALQALAGAVPQVIVSDIGMPNDDGYSLIRRVRSLPDAQGGGVPAIALTAFTRELDRARAKAAGFQEHLAKPVVPDLLVAAICRVLPSR